MHGGVRANQRSKKQTTVMSERRARFQMPYLQITVPNAHVVEFPK
jgi:hypothetical protein